MHKPNLLLLGLFTFLVACEPSEPLFRLVPSSQSGITFSNAIAENDSFNVIDYTYLYNGGGVGVGDVNNDGLDDIFLPATKYQVGCT